MCQKLLKHPEPQQSVACPLNSGVAVLDHLLAGLMGEADGSAFDAALDLRWLLANSENAEAIVHQFLVLRTLVEERHYLSCYRLRRWLETQLVGLVSVDRQHEPEPVSLRLDATDLNELLARCVRAASRSSAPWAKVSFEFSKELVSA